MEKCSRCKRICDPYIFDPRTECDFSNRHKMFEKSHCHYLESCSVCGNKICGHCIEEEKDGTIKCYGCYWWASCDKCDETVHRYDDSHKDECEWIICDKCGETVYRYDESHNDNCEPLKRGSGLIDHNF
jgi:hypothetical protein